MWSQLSCRHFRKLLALHAGSDLTADEQVSVERHMAACPSCRSHFSGLSDSQTVLQRASVLRLMAQAQSPASATANGGAVASVEAADSGASGDQAPGHCSLWGAVRERLPVVEGPMPLREGRRRSGRGEYDLRNWAVAGLSLACCVMLTLVLQTIPGGSALSTADSNAGVQAPVVQVVVPPQATAPKSVLGKRAKPVE
jgi:hypothetical protein